MVFLVIFSLLQGGSDPVTSNTQDEVQGFEMRKHLKTENSNQSHGKSNHKSGWLTGMLHVLDFNHWRIKNQPICWKTPRTHSLMRETDEQDSVSEEDPKKPKRQETKVMTTKQVTEYVDFLEILKKEDVFIKITKDSKSKQVQIKSNPRVLPKSGSFPLSRSSRPAKIEHKQRENWYAPKQNVAVLTLNVPKDTSQEHKPIFPSNGLADDRGFNHAVINGFREIKKLIKNAVKDRKDTKSKSKSLDVSKDDYVRRYSKFLEHSFKREGGELRLRSLKLSYEEKKSDSIDNKPCFFRRISSLSSLEVLGSFLTDLPKDGSTKKSIDQDANSGSLSVSESMLITEKEEQRSHENHKSLDVCSTGLSLSSLEIHNQEEEVEDAYFCFVKTVLEVSRFLENEDNEERWHSENQPLDPSLLYKLKIQEEGINKELLFDLVNEAITETRNQSHIYFPKTFSFAYPNEKRFLDEVWRRVKWSLFGLGDENKDSSLDDIVGRDLTKVDGWMNLRSESEWLTLELEDLILDEVLDELLFV